MSVSTKITKDENLNTLNGTVVNGVIIPYRFISSPSPYQLPLGNSNVITGVANSITYLPADAPFGTIVTVFDTGSFATTHTLNVAPGSNDNILLLSANNTPYTIAIGGSVTVMKADNGSPGLWIVTAYV